MEAQKLQERMPFKKQMYLIMNKSIKYFLLTISGGLISFFVSARILALQAVPGFGGEIISHSTLILKLQENSLFYSFWYLFQKLIILDDIRNPVLLASGFLMLGMFSFIKGASLAALFSLSRFHAVYSLILVLLLCLAVPVDFPFVERRSPGFGAETFYIGTIPSNTFMSATQYVANIFSIPAVFGIALYFNKLDGKNYLWAFLLSLIAILAKPGIAPGLVAIWALSALYLRSNRIQLAGSVVAILALAIPTLAIYFSMMTGNWISIKTVFAPFAIWKFYSSHLFIDLLASWMFPISALIASLLCRNVRRLDRIYLLTAWIISLSSLFPFIFLAESVDGQLSYAGNYLWGAISATSALYVVSAYVISSQSWKVKGIPLLILCWCGWSGFVYLTHYGATGSFL